MTPELKAELKSEARSILGCAQSNQFDRLDMSWVEARLQGLVSLVAEEAVRIADAVIDLEQWPAAWGKEPPAWVVRDAIKLGIRRQLKGEKG